MGNPLTALCKPCNSYYGGSMYKCFGVLALALCSAAHAAPVTIWATYSGFFDVQKGAFDPNIKLTMYAELEDRNSDQRYDHSEVLGFRFGAVTGDSEPCNPWGLRSFSCLTAFSYQPGGELSFAGHRRTDYREAGANDRSASVVSGSAYTVSGGINQIPWSRTLQWAPETQLSISPIPEPTTIGMLVGGLAVVTLARRRRA